MPSLADSSAGAIDGRTLWFLLKKKLASKKKEEKEKKRQERDDEQEARATQLAQPLAQQYEAESSSSRPRSRKRRRKKKLPKSGSRFLPHSAPCLDRQWIHAFGCLSSLLCVKVSALFPLGNLDIIPSCSWPLAVTRRSPRRHQEEFLILRQEVLAQFARGSLEIIQRAPHIRQSRVRCLPRPRSRRKLDCSGR